MTAIQIEARHVEAFRAAVAAIRPADEVRPYLDTDMALGELRWTPDLTPTELDQVTAIRQEIRTVYDFTPAEWQALRPIVGSIRTHRTRTNTEWAALTAAQRDQALIDWCRDLTDVLRALLRD